MSNVTLLSVDVNVSPEIKGLVASAGESDKATSGGFSEVMQRQMKNDESGNGTSNFRKDEKQTAADEDNAAIVKQEKQNIDEAEIDKKERVTKNGESKTDKEEINGQEKDQLSHQGNDSSENIVQQEKSAFVNTVGNNADLNKEDDKSVDKDTAKALDDKPTNRPSGSNEFINMLDKANKLLVSEKVALDKISADKAVAGQIAQQNQTLDKRQAGNDDKLQSVDVSTVDEDNKVVKKSELAQIIQQALTNNKSNASSTNVNTDKTEHEADTTNNTKEQLSEESQTSTRSLQSPKSGLDVGLTNQNKKLNDNEVQTLLDKTEATKTPDTKEGITADLINRFNKETNEKNNKESLRQHSLSEVEKLKAADLASINQADSQLKASELISSVNDDAKALTLEQLKQLTSQKTLNEQVSNQNKQNEIKPSLNEFKMDKDLSQINAEHLASNEQELVKNASAQTVNKSAEVTAANAALASVLAKDIEKQAATSAVNLSSKENIKAVEEQAIEQLTSLNKSERDKPKTQTGDIATNAQATVNNAFANIHSAAATADDLNSSQLAAQIESIANKQVLEADIQVKNSQIQLAETININRKDFAESIKSKVMMLVNQKLQQVDIRLDPPELGSMQIKVNLQNDTAAVNFVVQNPQAKEALDQHMSKLKDMLNNSGVNVGDTSVEQQKQNAKEQQEAFADSNGQSQQGNQEQQSVENNAAQLHTMVNHSAVGVDFYA